MWGLSHIPIQPSHRPSISHSFSAWGIMSWDLDGGFCTPQSVRTPRLTVRCEYPGAPPTDAVCSGQAQPDQRVFPVEMVPETDERLR